MPREARIPLTTSSVLGGQRITGRYVAPFTMTFADTVLIQGSEASCSRTGRMSSMRVSGCCRP
jgi:hypothetical protein